MQEETRAQGGVDKNLTKLQRFLHAADQDIELALERARSMFGRGTTAHLILAMLEPAFTGFVLAVLLPGIGAVAGTCPGRSLCSLLIAGTVEYATPSALVVGGLGTLASLTISERTIAKLLCVVLIAPLLRLSHYLSMLSFGVLLACLWKQVMPDSVVQTAPVLCAAIAVVSVGIYGYASNRLLTVDPSSGLTGYRTYRLLVLFAGAVLCTSALLALQGSTSLRGIGST